MSKYRGKKPLVQTLSQNFASWLQFSYRPQSSLFSPSSLILVAGCLVVLLRIWQTCFVFDKFSGFESRRNINLSSPNLVVILHVARRFEVYGSSSVLFQGEDQMWKCGQGLFQTFQFPVAGIRRWCAGAEGIYHNTSRRIVNGFPFITHTGGTSSGWRASKRVKCKVMFLSEISAEWFLKAAYHLSGFFSTNVWRMKIVIMGNSRL